MGNINQIIQAYLDFYPQERKNIHILLDQASTSSNLLDRKRVAGHITASAIVIEDSKLLMIFHPFFKKWLQPGGHVEQGETPLDAAKRELVEETGFQANLHSWHKNHIIPFDIDIHFIPTNEKKEEESHFHYDFRYLLCIDKNAVVKGRRDHELAWIHFEQIEEESLIKLLNKFNSR